MIAGAPKITVDRLLKENQARLVFARLIRSSVWHARDRLAPVDVKLISWRSRTMVALG